MSNLLNPIFQDEAKAREWLEARVWPNGPVCPHCGNADQDKITGLQGKAHRPGLYQCAECREQFTVTVKTVFERSKIPLSKWLAALFLMTASKKGVSAHQVHRMLGVSYKSTWFMMHRLREAMKTGGLDPLGGEGKTVEIDETYVGGKERNKHRSKREKKNIGGTGKQIVFALVERDGSVRSHHVPSVSAKTLRPILEKHVNAASQVYSDDGGSRVSKEFPNNASVNHSIGEYVRGDVHTNTIEGYFSILKRGINGVYHHVSEKHLHRYLAEFDFRYSNRAKLGVDDYARAEIMAKGIVGKRLTYRRSNRQKDADAN